MAFPPPHSFMFDTHEDHEQLPSTSLNTFLSFPPQHFQQGAPFLLKRSMSFSGIENKCHDHHEVHGDDELSDDGFQSGEKKKMRLNLEQVKALEKSFELGNKLEPERKVQLAKALGLKPRQIAIWFQNRRARWKTKQLEKEYEVLKKKFEAVKDENDTLKVHNQKLQAELQALKSRHWCEGGTKCLKKETEVSWSNGSDNSSNIDLDLSRTQALNGPVSLENGKNLISLLPTSLNNSSNIPQLLQFTSRSDLQDESFSNMFHNINEHQNLWPWPYMHNFH